MIDPDQAQLDRERRAWREAIDGYWNAKAVPGDEKTEKHRARVRRLGRVTTDFDWKVALDLYRHKCGLCGVHEDEEKMTIDHIIPISRGGGNWQWNVRPLCEYCNSNKGSALDAECWAGRVEGTTDW